MKELFKYLICIVTIGLLFSCDKFDEIDHKLDVEFCYELTCSDALLKYVTPEITFTDAKGIQRTISIESSMWDGNEHKTWRNSIHYDSLNVSNTATIKYIPNLGITYQDEIGFENIHNLSCLISIKEDGDGRRNNNTIVPDFPSKTNVTAEELKNYIEKLSKKTFIRGGTVDIKGEIIKIENEN